ncbi:hypothetical protein RRG08_008073 [Elysia crispata]|uniref:Uncharacterized protein n=1 Tax=Elysia crispata TaxID=231223 RepID=A0AAE1DC94_9GAST|nr:hypothetical protein RRG08_008073 [Elysia crispata]
MIPHCPSCCKDSKNISYCSEAGGSEPPTSDGGVDSFVIQVLTGGLHRATNRRNSGECHNRSHSVKSRSYTFLASP